MLVSCILVAMSIERLNKIKAERLMLYLVGVKSGDLQDGVAFRHILGNTLVVVGAWKPGAVVVHILDVDDHLGRVRVWRTAEVLGSNDQLVGVLE